MKRFDQFVMSIDDQAFMTQEDFYNDVGQVLKLLLKYGNTAVVRQEERDIIVIEYNHDERFDGWGCPNPYWLTDEEYFQYDIDDEEWYEDTFGEAVEETCDCKTCHRGDIECNNQCEGECQHDHK